MDDVIMIEVGKMGPAGLGVTAPDWNQIRAEVTTLLNVPRGVTLRNGGHEIVIGSFANAGGGLMSAPVAAISGLNSSLRHRIVARGSCTVTTAAGKTANFFANLATVGNFATGKTAPANTKSTQLFYGSWDRPAGPTSFQVGIWYQTSDATVALFADARIEIEVTPFE